MAEFIRSLLQASAGRGISCSALVAVRSSRAPTSSGHRRAIRRGPNEGGRRHEWEWEKRSHSIDQVRSSRRAGLAPDNNASSRECLRTASSCKRAHAREGQLGPWRWPGQARCGIVFADSSCRIISPDGRERRARRQRSRPVSSRSDLKWFGREQVPAAAMTIGRFRLSWLSAEAWCQF